MVVLLHFFAPFFYPWNPFYDTVDLDNEELLSEEERGLLPTVVKNQIDECLGNVRNKFLTKITSK